MIYIQYLSFTAVIDPYSISFTFLTSTFLISLKIYDTAQMQYYTCVVYTQLFKWTMPSPHTFWFIVLTCLPTCVRMWPDYGKLTKLSHLGIATDFKSLMI